jgi:hypothetical protein
MSKNAWNLSRLVGLCSCGCSSLLIAAVELLLGMQPSDVGSLILVDPAWWDPFG